MRKDDDLKCAISKTELAELLKKMDRKRGCAVSRGDLRAFLKRTGKKR